MTYEITTAVSPDYSRILGLCMPSWISNAGAERIRVWPVGADRCGTQEEQWYRQAYQRCVCMQKAVEDAVASGTRLLALDLDCFVLSDLSGGFSDTKPISVARWPDINMGVLFFNCRLSFPWLAFFEELTDRIEKRTEELIAEKPKKFRPADQAVWLEVLHDWEKHVHKLDANVWNFCYSGHEWDEQVARHKAGIKVLHWKARHYGTECPVMESIKRDFGNVLGL